MHLSSVPCLISMHLSFVLCFLSHVFPVSCIPRLISFASHVVRYLICFMSRLRSCLNPQAAQAVSQHSDRVSNHVSTLSHVSQSVMLNKDWDRRRLEEQNVYRESRHPVFCKVIGSVTHEISYIQPIHWWDFRFTFWQVIQPGRRLLPHELCLRILLPLNLTSDLKPPICDPLLDLWPDLWILTRPLTSDLRTLTSDLRPLQPATSDWTSDPTSDPWYLTFWLLTYGRADLQLLTRPLTWLLTFDRWAKAADLRPLTRPLTQPLTSDFWSSIFDQRPCRPSTPYLTFDQWSLISDLKPTFVF